MGENVGQAAARPGDGGLPDVWLRSGTVAVPLLPPPVMEGRVWNPWRSLSLLLERQLRDSSVKVKCQYSVTSPFLTTRVVHIFLIVG